MVHRGRLLVVLVFVAGNLPDSQRARTFAMVQPSSAATSPVVRYCLSAVETDIKKPFETVELISNESKGRFSGFAFPLIQFASISLYRLACRAFRCGNCGSVVCDALNISTLHP